MDRVTSSALIFLKAFTQNETQTSKQPQRVVSSRQSACSCEMKLRHILVIGIAAVGRARLIGIAAVGRASPPQLFRFRGYFFGERVGLI